MFDVIILQLVVHFMLIATNILKRNFGIEIVDIKILLRSHKEYALVCWYIFKFLSTAMNEIGLALNQQTFDLSLMYCFFSETIFSYHYLRCFITLILKPL